MFKVDLVLDRNMCSNGQKRDGLRSDLQDLLDRASDELTSKDKHKFRSLLIENQDLFASSDAVLGKANPVKHKITTGNATPFDKVPNGNFEKISQKGIIEPSHIPRAEEIVLEKKKDDSYRFCVHFLKTRIHYRGFAIR